jgi:hypothetical protein
MTSIALDGVSEELRPAAVANRAANASNNTLIQINCTMMRN